MGDARNFVDMLMAIPHTLKRAGLLDAKNPYTTPGNKLIRSLDYVYRNDLGSQVAVLRLLRELKHELEDAQPFVSDVPRYDFWGDSFEIWCTNVASVNRRLVEHMPHYWRVPDHAYEHLDIMAQSSYFAIQTYREVELIPGNKLSRRVRLVSVEDSFRDYVLDRIREECPRASDSFCQRLATAVVQRRKVLNYHRWSHGYSVEEVTWMTSIEAPTLSPDAASFICPFCLFELRREWSEPVAWRQHLQSDLEIYLCIYDICPQEQEWETQSTCSGPAAMRRSSLVQLHSSHQEIDWFDQMTRDHLEEGKDWVNGNWSCSTKWETQTPRKLYAKPMKSVNSVNLAKECHLCGEVSPGPSEHVVVYSKLNQNLDKPGCEATRQTLRTLAHIANHLMKMMQLAFLCVDNLSSTDLDGPYGGVNMFVPQASPNPRCMAKPEPASLRSLLSENQEIEAWSKNTWIFPPGLGHVLGNPSLGDIIVSWRLPNWSENPRHTLPTPPATTVQPCPEACDLWPNFLLHVRPPLYDLEEEDGDKDDDDDDKLDVSRCSFERLETIHLAELPSDKDISERVKASKIKRIMRDWDRKDPKTIPVFLVTGLKVARGFKLEPEQAPVDLIYAYQVHVIACRGTRRGPCQLGAYRRAEAMVERNAAELHVVEAGDLFIIPNSPLAFPIDQTVKISEVASGNEELNVITYERDRWSRPGRGNRDT